MRPHPRFPVAAGGGPRIALVGVLFVSAPFVPLWTAALAAIGGLALAPKARADEMDDLRAKFLAGTDEERATILKGLEGRPAQVGTILGPVLHERATKVPAAQAAAWLADRAKEPKDGKEGGLLLEEEVLRRAAGDAPFLEEVRARLTPGGSGWSALVGAARRRLLDPAGAVDLKVAAVSILRYEPTSAVARDLVEAWGAGPEEVASAARDTLASLLCVRFADLEQAKAFVGQHEKQPLIDWIRDLSLAKDRPDALIYRRLVAEARLNIERAATFEDLYGYFDRAQNPWPEIRRLAARRAAKVKGSGDAWIAVLEDAVAHETDRETLAALLEVTATLREGADERTFGLVQNAVERLGRCCNEPEIQKGLLGVLARVGSPDKVEKAYEALKGREVRDAGVLEAWLAAAGAVGGNELALCDFHRQQLGKDDDDTVRLRVRALEALARGASAAGAGWSNVAVASTYLRGILRRDDTRAEEKSLPRELEAQARLAAVRGLEGFPSPETVARLRDLVQVPPETPELARFAVSVLGKLAAKRTDAAQALIDVTDSRANAEARIEAVRDLARIAPDADKEVRDAVLRALQNALRPDAGPFALRVAAAESAATLAEGGVLENVGALPGVLALVAEASGRGPDELTSLLDDAAERLVRALAKVGEKYDATLIEQINRLGGDGLVPDAARLAAARNLAEAVADAGAGRLGFQSLRATLYVKQAGLPGRDAAARRADLSEAHKILRSATHSQDGAEAKSAGWAGALRLHQQVVTALLADPDTPAALRRTALVAGLDLLVRRRELDPALARAWLDEAKGLADLTPEERATIDRAAAEVAKPAPPTAPK